MAGPPSLFVTLMISAVSAIFALMVWSGVRSGVRVVVDHARSSFLVVSGERRIELPFRGISNAAIASRGTHRGLRHQLILVLPSGEHVPATNSFHPYSDQDCKRVVEAINGELAPSSKSGSVPGFR
jgi:hypothetical protein